MSPVHVGALALAAGITLAPSRSSEPPKKAPEPGLHRVTQEVAALRTLYELRLTPEQMQSLLKLAKQTRAPDREYKKGKASDDYRSLLNDLRKALVEAGDTDRIDELEEKVSDLADSEQPDVDDTFEVTAKARQRVPEVFKQLKPAQVAAYYSRQADDVGDPLDDLVALLDDVRELKPDEWKEQRDETAEEIAWLVAGVDAVKGEKVYNDVLSLTKQAREATDEEYKAKKPDLEKKARAVVGDISPDQVLRHHLERTLAELLSNPCLEDALKARLEPEK